jgi:hypothetical protein
MYISLESRVQLIRENQEPKLVLLDTQLKLGTTQNFNTKKLLAYESESGLIHAYVLERSDQDPTKFTIIKTYSRNIYSTGSSDVEATSIAKFVEGKIPFYIIQKGVNQDSYVFYDKDHSEIVAMPEVISFVPLLTTGIHYQLKKGIHVMYLLKQGFVIITKGKWVVITSHRKMNMVHIKEVDKNNVVVMDNLAIDNFKMRTDISSALKTLDTVDSVVTYLKKQLAFSVI